MHPGTVARIDMNRRNLQLTLFESVDIVCEMSGGDERHNTNRKRIPVTKRKDENAYRLTDMNV